jgi:hypothetical protein
MSTLTFRRVFVRAATAAAILSALTACNESRTTEPQRAVHSAVASHDDDPTTCRSGWQVIDGHVVCN